MPGTQRKAVINSKTSGRYRTRTVGGREHIITDMVPIVGDTVMNSIHYPDAEVEASFKQLNNLPAPAGHPIIEGQSVSAFHPMAINAHNIGGFIRSPVKREKKVIAEFWLDTEIAGNSDNGVETVRRIKAGEKVGVSTGLGLTLVAQNGTADDGKEFTAVGKDYKFDHVAILLNEVAAGDHVGTELVTNDGVDLVVGFVENTTVHEMMSQIERALETEFGGEDIHIWLRDFIIEENAAIYQKHDNNMGTSGLFKVGIVSTDGQISVSGMPMPVEEQVSFVGIDGQEPEQPVISTGIVNTNTEEEEMEITRENATEFLVNLGLTVTDPESAVAVANAEAIATFETNKEAFDAFMAKNAADLETKRAECIEKTGLTAENVEHMDIETMDALIAKVTTTTNHQLRAGGGAPIDPASDGATTASNFMSGASAAKE